MHFYQCSKCWERAESVSSSAVHNVLMSSTHCLLWAHSAQCSWSHRAREHEVFFFPLLLTSAFLFGPSQFFSPCSIFSDLFWEVFREIKGSFKLNGSMSVCAEFFLKKTCVAVLSPRSGKKALLRNLPAVLRTSECRQGLDACVKRTRIGFVDRWAFQDVPVKGHENLRRALRDQDRGPYSLASCISRWLSTCCREYIRSHNTCTRWVPFDLTQRGSLYVLKRFGLTCEFPFSVAPGKFDLPIKFNEGWCSEIADGKVRIPVPCLWAIPRVSLVVEVFPNFFFQILPLLSCRGAPVAQFYLGSIGGSLSAGSLSFRSCVCCRMSTYVQAFFFSPNSRGEGSTFCLWIGFSSHSVMRKVWIYFTFLFSYSGNQAESIPCQPVDALIKAQAEQRTFNFQIPKNSQMRWQFL